MTPTFAPQPSADLAEVELACPECDYNLKGVSSDRCPWCGWIIDVDELVASSVARRGRTRLRWAVVAAALAVGVGSIVALGAQLPRGKQLQWRDALAVVSVLAAGIAHLVLVATAIRSGGRWPLPGGEMSNVLRFVGWASMACGVVAATPLLQAAPTPRFVKGVQVNGVLEFGLTAVFFALPGAMLLVLRMISFRHAGQKVHSPFRRDSEESEAGSPFLVESDRLYQADQISQSVSEERRPTHPAVEEMIARTWEAENSLGSQTDRIFYNGRLARLVRAEAALAGLHLILGETCYRDFLGTNLLNAGPVLRFGRSFLADALGISGLVATSDGFLALGRRGRRVAYHAGFLHPFGGMVEDVDRADESYDLLKAMKRELFEELGLRNEDIAEAAVTGLVRDRTILQPELLFDVSAGLTRAEVGSRFAIQRSEEEHAGVEFVADEPEAILGFLQRTPKISPVGQAALLLHGKHLWGADWYEQSCYLLYGGIPAGSAANTM